MTNFAKRTDGYKPSHWLFMEPGIQETYDYMESRGGEYADMTVFGLQAHCLKYLCGSVISPPEVDQAYRFYSRYYGLDNVFNYRGWMDIATRLGGVLPLEIRALPEGMIVPVRTPMLAYKNTDPSAWWLPGPLEPLLFKTWNTATVATVSQHCKKVLLDGLKETGTEADIIWKLHDFGYRGVSSEESAAAAGAAHLVHFCGTDTIPAIDFVNEYYGDGEVDAYGDPTYMPGFSVRGTEHSVMTHRGRKLEAEVVGRILKLCPTGIIAMVGDSYDIFNFAGQILGEQFHSEIIARDGLVVIRPDSGDPVSTMMKLLWILGEKFGWDINSKGFRVLKHVRTLQGDKNDYNAIYKMVRALTGAGWSLDCIGTFGMGGALLQQSTRDTQQMAVKLSSLTDSEGEWRAVFKDPVTDPGKYSKAGRFAVVIEGGKVVTKVLEQGEPEPPGNLLQPVYRNGVWLKKENFETIRARARKWME
jgi:nicotinamide phosphoribosyltransferase